MVLRLLCVAAFAAALFAAFGASPQTAGAADGSMFYNYYVPPVYAGGVGAQLYVAPRPVPPSMGHTYITYQPLMPHEFLYRHGRTYIRHHASGEATRTRVRYR